MIELSLVKDIGTSKKEIYESYSKYKLLRESGMGKCLAGSIAFNIDFGNKEAIFFVITGMSVIKDIIEHLKEEEDR